MSWRLDQSGKPAIPIVKDDTTIGSSEHCGVRIQGLQPQQALLRVVAGRLFLETVDEAPLFVNGQSLGQSFLKPGDKIQFAAGGEEFVLNKADAPVEVAPPPQAAASGSESLTIPYNSEVRLPKKVSRNSTPSPWIITAAVVPLLLIVVYFASPSKTEQKTASKAATVVPDARESKPEPEVMPVQPLVAEVKPAPQLPEAIKQHDEVIKPGAAKPETPPAAAPPAVVGADPFPVGSVWKNNTLKMSLTVAQRDGDTFQGKFVVGQAITREVKGTVKDGEVRWLARQVRAVRGDAGGDHIGKFGESDRSNALDFEWTSNHAFRKFILQRE